MKQQEPKNFKDILELQKILDENIHSSRERTLSDIYLSIVAEIIEFNEETERSHKTWKSKPYDREKELEEYTDIWFFVSQLVTFLKLRDIFYDLDDEEFVAYSDDSPRKIEYLFSLLRETLREGYSFENENEFLKRKTKDICYFLVRLGLAYGYMKDDILKTYWKKWQKNMARIGKEWN